MEPVSMIVSALVLGAIAGLKDTAKTAVKDAYQGLKNAIKAKYGHVDVGVIEADLKSEPRKSVLEDELKKTPVGSDEEVLSLAKQLVEVVQQQAPETERESSVEIERVKAGLDVTIKQVIADRVSVKDVTATRGKIDIEDVGNVVGVRVGRIGGSIEGVMINGGQGVQVGDGAQQTNTFGAPVSRYLQGRLGNHAHLGERVPLQVRVALQAGNDSSIALKAMPLPPEGGDVKLVLYCPGFEAKSATMQVVHIPAGDNSDWTLFELEARQQGVFTIEVSAYRDATFLGVLQMQVTVDNQKIAGNSMDCTAPLSHRSPRPGEVTLLIHYDDKDRVYRYQLIDHTIGSPDEMRSSVLQRTPQDAIEDLIKRLNAQARDLTRFTAKATREWLIGKGIDLWNEFIPRELQDLFWERRDRMKHLTILSSGDPVPWEVLYPFKPGQEDGGFLGEQLSISRWRYGPAATDRLRLPTPYFVLPAGSPPTATSEITALRALIGNASTVNELEELLNVFTDAKFGLLHFACHNTFSPASPTSSYVTMGQQSFEPTFLSRYAEKFRPQSPLVFMNACRTDAVAPNYTRLTGWADRFLSAGAGAFIGTLWEVRDTSASEFAGEFYSTLLEGATLADAMKAGRATIQGRPGDPTWLAYTLYGDPTATLATEA